MGDPSGIGPDIVSQAVARLKGLAEFTVIGDARLLGRMKGERIIDLKNVKMGRFAFGTISPEYGRASIEYLDKAMELIAGSQIDCLVTAPISKESINAAGSRYSGHTEYLARRTGSSDTVMVLLNRRLKIALATRHIPLKDVTGLLDKAGLKRLVATFHSGLKNAFGIPAPRIVVCGVNPHASDNGLLGNEENRIIKPLIRAMGQGVAGLCGPFSADVAMKKAYEGYFDGVIAMYHDQALIALKLTGAESGVNLTLGLPFIRTSPLHGTAFDIAGKKAASADSMMAAVKLAIKCTRNLKKKTRA